MSSPGFRLMLDFAAQLDGGYPASYGIGPAGELWVVVRDRPRPQWPDDHAYWFEPHQISLVSFGGAVKRPVISVEVPSHTAFVQPLQNDQFLLVRARIRNGCPNALVVDSDGSTVCEFLLGDGIKDVQTTITGDIWVSYFDEGVFGGEWNDPDGGYYENRGLIRATATGAVSWVYSAPDGVDPIADCYALNVAGDGKCTWACYYSAFPLVSITDDGAVRAWHTDEKGTEAIAVAGDRVAFAGDWSWRDHLVLGRLDNEAKTVSDKRRISASADDGTAGGILMGRGSQLHRISDTRWYQLDLQDLAA